MTLWKALQPFPTTDSPEASYQLPKREGLALAFATVVLGVRFPIIGMTDEQQRRYEEELEALGLVTLVTAGDLPPTCRLTSFGHEVSQQSFDINLGILSCVCARLGVPWHGRIAAAYLQTGRDVFAQKRTIGSQGLLPAQIARTHTVGFGNDWQNETADSSAAFGAVDEAKRNG